MLSLEVVPLPVTVNRALTFYTEQIGFILDIEYHPLPFFRAGRGRGLLDNKKLALEPGQVVVLHGIDGGAGARRDPRTWQRLWTRGIASAKLAGREV